MKLQKGDRVKITAGKDRGREGVVEKVFSKEGKVLVPGINICKKHVKPRGEKQPGGIVEMPRPLPVAKMALLCPKCKQPTRVGYQFRKDKNKSRICQKCNQLIDD